MSPPRRIGYVIWSLGLGGAEQVVIRLAAECARRGREVRVYTLNAPGVFADRLQPLGIPVVSIGKRGPLDVGALVRLKRAFEEWRPDVVHTHLWGANLWGRVAARMARVPTIIVTEHNVDTWKRGMHLAVDRWLAPWATRLVAVSQQVREFYETRGVGRGRWHVIYNGIDPQPPTPQRRGQAFQALGIGSDEPVAGWVGRLVPAKAPEIFLEAAAIAMRELPALKVLIVGDGPLRREAEAHARRLGIGHRVVFAGLRHDVPELLQGMNALVFSSDREGFSMAMLEAMACGVPVIATRVGGTPELIESGVTGLLVPPRDPGALAQQMIALLNAPATAEAIRQASRARITQQFSLRAMVDAYDTLYRAGETGAEAAGAALPTKIVYVIDHLGAGGAQRQLVELVRRLPRAQWDPVVVCLSRDHTALASELEDANVPVRVIGQHGVFDPACLWILTRLLQRERPAIVHTWLFTADTYGRLAARLANTGRVVCSIRNTVDDMPWHHRLVHRWLSGGTACVTVNAEAIRSRLVRDVGIPEQKVRTIYNGVEVRPPGFAAANGASRDAWHIPAQSALVAMIARLAPQKDHRTLLQAVRHLLDRGVPVCCLLVGDGPLRATIDEWVAEFGLREQVRLLGQREDIPQVLEQIDLCVLATHFEGCSNVIMEAMAAGKPVIATDVGGNAELVVDGETGLLVPPRDPEALAAACRKLLQDPETARMMGARGRQRIVERFSSARMVEQTLGLYAELLGHTKAGQG